MGEAWQQETWTADGGLGAGHVRAGRRQEYRNHRDLTVLTSFVLGLQTHTFKSALVNMGSGARLAAELARI